MSACRRPLSPIPSFSATISGPSTPVSVPQSHKGPVTSSRPQAGLSDPGDTNSDLSLQEQGVASLSAMMGHNDQRDIMRSLEVKSVLGMGGYGAVYKCAHPQLTPRCADWPRSQKRFRLCLALVPAPAEHLYFEGRVVKRART